MNLIINLRDNARHVAEYHAQVEPGLTQVWYYPDPDNKEIRLLEIVAGSPRTNEAFPFRFAPDLALGVHFPVVIVELSPDDYVKLKRRQRHIPSNWKGAPEPIWSRTSKLRQ